MLKPALYFRAASFTAAVILGITSLTPRALADAVVIKGGERIEGKILSETDTEVTIQYNASATIKDERTIKKTDVEKIEKASPDVEAWNALKEFKVKADSLEPAVYTHYLNLLNSFVTQFPASANAAAAKASIAALEAEKKRVDAGEFKFDNKWLSKEQVQKERVQLLGNAYLQQMKRFAAGGAIAEAMTAFEQLEKQAPGSAAYPEAVELARLSLTAFKQGAEAGLAKLKSQAAEEKAMLEKLSEPKKSQTAKELKAMRDRAEATIAAIERSGAKWVPLNPATERSLSSISSKAGSEISRLNSIQVENMKQSLREVEKAKAAVASGDLEGATAAFTKAGQLWNANEQVQRGIASIASARKAEVDKVAADKVAAAEAVKAASEAEAAAKKAAIDASLKPVPIPEPVAVVEEEPKKKEESFLSKPVFWIFLVILIAAGAMIRKALHKFKDPSSNILDQ